DRRLHLCFFHRENVSPALKVLMCEYRPADYREVGAGAQVIQLAALQGQLCNGSAGVDSVLGAINDAVDHGDLSGRLAAGDCGGATACTIESGIRNGQILNLSASFDVASRGFELVASYLLFNGSYFLQRKEKGIECKSKKGCGTILLAADVAQW
ncbi:MAG: hypothetical protein IIV98_02330, partial [Aeriscardovia sp.]|nr:hypothetical protein [Aeriscardovia sp.]